MARMLRRSSLIDQDGHVVPILEIRTTYILPFTNVSDSVQLPVIPLPSGSTTRTGQVVSFTASEDCWVKLGVNAVGVTAVPATTKSTDAVSTHNGNFFIARGSVLGPIDMNANDAIAAVRQTTSGTLSILLHDYRYE